MEYHNPTSQRLCHNVTGDVGDDIVAMLLRRRGKRYVTTLSQ